MNIIRNLSSLALVSVLNVSPCFALSQSLSVSLPDQFSSSQLEKVELAGFVDDVLNTVDRGLGILERERRQQAEREARQQAERERQEREAERQRRQEELEAARRAASEQERLEAERRQQYFESLSPEEQEAYLAEQNAGQAEADRAAMIFLLQMFAIGVEMDASNASSEETTVCRGGSADSPAGYTYYQCSADDPMSPL